MIKQGILALVFMCVGISSGFAQVLLLKKNDSGSASGLASRIELEMTEWFFEQGIMTLSEQNPTTEVEIELALYMLQQVNAKALLLWSLDSVGNFRLMIYRAGGEFLGEEELRIDVKDNEAERSVMKKVTPLLQKVKSSLR